MALSERILLLSLLRHHIHIDTSFKIPQELLPKRSMPQPDLYNILDIA
jgi:hypothetical protein